MWIAWPVGTRTRVKQVAVPTVALALRWRSELSTTSIVILVIVVVIVLALAAVVAAFVNRERQRRLLQDRFGPEYARTVDSVGGKKEAEANLRERIEQRDTLVIKPLGPGERDRYQQEWRQVQAAFVDVPGPALARADSLVTSVMVARGYPVDDFEGRADLASVDHPQVIENYRQAHGVFVASRSRGAATDEMRQAFVSYRSLFSELVGDGRNDLGATAADATSPSN